VLTNDSRPTPGAPVPCPPACLQPTLVELLVVIGNIAVPDRPEILLLRTLSTAARQAGEQYPLFAIRHSARSGVDRHLRPAANRKLRPPSAGSSTTIALRPFPPGTSTLCTCQKSSFNQPARSGRGFIFPPADWARQQQGSDCDPHASGTARAAPPSVLFSSLDKSHQPVGRCCR